MSIAFTLFSSDRTYPKDIILNKSTIPDDPNERLKDKVLMSTVFTVKRVCEYKNFITPETKFKDDIHVTEDQMKKILKTLSDRFNVKFDKDWFGTIRDLVLYIKDHKANSISQENAFTEACAKWWYDFFDEDSSIFDKITNGIFAPVLVPIYTILNVIFGYTDGEAKRDYEQKQERRRDDTFLWDKIKTEYKTLCSFSLKYCKDDPFLYKNTHDLLSIDDYIKILQMYKKRYELVEKVSKPRNGESTDAYSDRIRKVLVTAIPTRLEFSKMFPKRRSLSYADAQWLDAVKIDRAFELEKIVIKLCLVITEDFEQMDEQYQSCWEEFNMEETYEEYFQVGCTFYNASVDNIKPIVLHLRDVVVKQAKKQVK